MISFPGWMSLIGVLLFAMVASAQDTAYPPVWEQIPGPDCAPMPQWNSKDKPKTCSPAEIDNWLADIRHWRMEHRIRMGYEDSEYKRPELKWTQSSFVQPQMMVHDRYFYDVESHRYTVDRYLDDVVRRYGGIDSVLIWHTYPNLGIDDRNQYDLFRDLPGGLEGVREMVREFHRRGVRVLFPVMVWDQGTRSEGIPDAQAIAQELASVDADGINGDTQEGMPASFRRAADRIGHPLALEPEAPLAADEMLAYNDMSWGYWKYDFVPSVSRYKWLESRHMVNMCNRWAHDHEDDLQQAFFNGVGFESWENIWGIWNQLTARDAEALRRIATIERAFSGLLTSPDWVPHVPMEHFGVYASKFPSKGVILWTVVNRNHYPVKGQQWTVPYQEGANYYDLWQGVELRPAREGNESVIEFALEPDGYGAVLETPNAADPVLLKLLAAMKTLSQMPLSSFSEDWKTLPQRLVEIDPTAPPSNNPAGMVKIPGGDFTFQVTGIEIEGMNDEGVDVQYPWEASARRYHAHRMHINSFWIDKYPVTNAEFKRFLDATHYHPTDDHNFLKDWKNGTYPQGWQQKPVTWVSLEDARAYAKWVGKRLPHEWEWQYAAQGMDGRVYPWGNDWVVDAVPPPDKERDMAPASDVTSHPKGASPFGVMDLIGNVWQWTDEYVDEHTRAAVLRGGSHYQPQGSRWYFPQAYKLSEHSKYLLMAPSIDRSGAIGFRCVADSVEAAPN
ncbi:MAG: formylglycine-generating enzyme family protein [Candidatus Acidiferrales bacterium]